MNVPQPSVYSVGGSLHADLWSGWGMHDLQSALLIASLSSGGVLIFSCGGTEQAGEHSNTAMGPEVYYASMGINGFTELLLNAGCTIRHLEYDQYPELHAYFIVQKQ